MGDSEQRLTAIESQPPDLAALPPGCAFAPRCVRAIDRCRAEAPPEVDLGERRTARCWLAADPHPNAPPLAGERRGGGMPVQSDSG